MNTQDFLASGGRIVRRRKGQRSVTTIAYRKTENGTIEYGATVFRRKDSSEHWTRDGQRQIAIDRLRMDPVTVPLPKVEHIGELDSYVRSCLVEHGCCGSRIVFEPEAN